MSLSNKISKLEETVRILQSKNIYLQEENQRVKLINEGKNLNEPNSFIPTESTNARVLLLENENITNKIKHVEQTFNNQLNFMKIEFDKKLSDIEFKQKKCFHPRNNVPSDLKSLIYKHDALNTRMRKVEIAMDEGLKKTVDEYLMNAKTSPNAKNKNTNDEKESPIPFTPVPSASIQLPFETPGDLHKSFSEEMEACSSPDPDITMNERPQFPSFRSQEVLEDTLPEITEKEIDELLTETSETESDEQTLQEAVPKSTTDQSFLAKRPPNLSHF